MAYIPYTTFFPEVLPYVTACPEMVAINAIRSAAIEFCTETEWLQLTLTPITGVLGQSQYVPATPTDTYIGRVMQAYWNGIELRATREELLAQQSMIDWRTVTGMPTMYLRTDSSTTLTLVPQPDQSAGNLTGALTMLISLIPTRSSTTCDPDLWNRFGEVIACGARARLYNTPAQAWTNMPAAQESMKLFKSGKSSARIERIRGLDRANVILRAPWSPDNYTQ